ncbi:Ionotropic receptor 140 [Cephus cinctus]|nr:Ionotropic receptor 140 [Cephus cinctus]
MVGLRCFTCIVLFLPLCTVVTGDLRKLNWVLKHNEKERLLQKFLVDAESHLMQNCPSRQMSIIAPNNQLLRAATPLFKGRPCFVGTNSEFMVQSREYANKNCVFVFIDRIDYDYLSTIFRHLPSDYDTKVRILSTNNILKDEVRKVLDLAHDNSIENVTVTFLENNVFKGFQMYSFTRNCKREVRISYAWVPEKGLKTYHYDDHSPRNLNKCLVSISTLPSEDSMNVYENPNGTLTVFGGFVGNLIQRFAEKLNFTAVVKYTEIRVSENVVNNTIVGLVSDVANRKSLIAIGRLFPTLPRLEYSDFTKSYDAVCLVWTTPAITDSAEDVLYSEFNTYLWVAVVSSIIFSCVFIYILSRIRSRNQERQTFIDLTIDVIHATVGTAVQRLPTSRPGRVYVLSYIFYAIVAITAYQTYLASILTVRKEVQLIKTEADIVRSKLIPGGGKAFLSVLQSQREESPSMPYLIDNFEDLVDIVAALDRIKYKKDFAFAVDLSIIQYYKRKLMLAGEEVYFYTFDECIILCPVTTLVRKGSMLTPELNDIIVRLGESGLMSWWKNENSNVKIQTARESNIELKKLKLWQLKLIFILYLSGIILSSFIMCLEIIFSALSKKKKSK